MSNEPELNLEEQNSIFAEIDEGLSGSSFKYNIKELEINTDGTIDLPQPEERKTEESYPTRKEFIVVLKDDTQILSFENDMEELKLVESCYTLEDGSTVCSETPLREVTYSGTKSQVKTKFFKYYLTDEEAETLKNDFRVRSVDIPPEQKGIVAELFDSQIGNFSRVRNGKNNPYDLLQIVCQMISGSFVEGEQIYQVKDIFGVNALLENATGKAFIYKKTRTVSGGFEGSVIFLYVKKNENNPFFGSFFAKGRTGSNQTIKGVSSGAEASVLNITYYFEEDYNWGLTRHSYYGNEQNPVIENQYNYSLDGTGVDVVIFDSGIILNHPEFQDKNGNSRIKTIDWFEAAGWPDTNTRMPPGSELYNLNYSDATGHGTHVAATVAGKTFGWAKNSDIYVINAFGNVNWAQAMNFTNEFTAALYLVKEWHKRKPIDPKTGFKRPTVMNHSWGYSSQYGLESSFLIGWHAKTQDNKCIFFNSQLSPTGIKSIFYKNQLYTGEIVQNLDLFTTPQINTLKNTSLSELINAMYSCFGTILSPRDSYVAQGPSFSIPGTNFSNLTLGLYVGLPSTGNFVRVSEVDDMFEEAIQEGIHICMAAGNSSVNICNEDDPEYNNYAVIQSINPYNPPYTYDPNTSTYIPTPENEVAFNEITYYYNRKASPYAKNAIVVGAIDSLKKEESTNQNIELSPFINGNVFGLDTRVIFSNYGSGVDIWAAGTDIISASHSFESNASLPYRDSSQAYIFGPNLYPPNEYYGQIKFSGTSMASPQVCGVCALILQKYPNLTPVELKQKLIEYSLKGALRDGIETVNNQTLNYPIRNMNGQNLTFCFSDDCTNNSTTIKFNPPAARALFAYGAYNKNLNVLYSPFSSFVMQENISTTFSSNQVTFTWTFSKPPIHSHYDVYRSENENFGYEKLNSTPITVENYQDTTVIPGTTYYYRIYSVTTTGEAIQASTITVNFQNFNSLSKIIVYPVVYQKDTNGNIVKDENGLKIVEKSYREVNINDDYTIITDIKDAE